MLTWTGTELAPLISTNIEYWDNFRLQMKSHTRMLNVVVNYYVIIMRL